MMKNRHCSSRLFASLLIFLFIGIALLGRAEGTSNVQLLSKEQAIQRANAFIQKANIHPELADSTKPSFVSEKKNAWFVSYLYKVKMHPGNVTLEIDKRTGAVRVVPME